MAKVVTYKALTIERTRVPNLEPRTLTCSFLLQAALKTATSERNVDPALAYISAAVSISEVFRFRMQRRFLAPILLKRARRALK